jgi:ribosomal protein S18 acetylase RimI-like enzyme
MIHIASAELTDLERLEHLEKQLFPGDRISSRQFRYLLNRANGFVLKAEQRGVLVGSIILLKRKKSDKLRIYSLGVAQAARKQGVAGELLRHAEKVAFTCGCNMLTLEVCEHNQPAIRLYRNAGFGLFGRKEKYYEDGCTALQMNKIIHPEDIRP